MAISPQNPNLQLIYVSEMTRSVKFYSKIFKTTPVFSSPRYVAFSAGSEALFAIWTGGPTPDPAAPRFSEIGIMLPSSKAVEELYQQWQQDSEIKIVRDLYKEVFGQTFLVEDPDGHIIRVCPKD